MHVPCDGIGLFIAVVVFRTVGLSHVALKVTSSMDSEVVWVW